jgi:hypothetical protein
VFSSIPSDSTKKSETTSLNKLTSASITERRKKLAIVDDLNDVIEKIDDIISASASSSRQKRATAMTCSLFDENLDDLIDIP